MIPVFKKRLDDSEAQKIKQFCASVDYFAIEQSLGFTDILSAPHTTYFYLLNDGEILSFGQITENFRFAQIWYGPVCDDRDLMIESILKIAEYYKERGFWYLGIQPYRKTGFEADYIEYKLNSQLRISYVYSNENTKASLEIDLDQSYDDIFSSFRKGHKSAVKKAMSLGIRVTEPESPADLDSFIEVYRSMCEERGITGHTRKETNGIYQYLVENKCGEILLAKDSRDAVLGGALFVFQGISVRYLLSAADPGRKELPVTHLILSTAINRAKTAGFRYFDFWGFNHFATPDDQVYMVNRFKRGFGGYYSFLMKRMNISLIPGGFKIFRLYNKARKLLPALKVQYLIRQK